MNAEQWAKFLHRDGRVACMESIRLIGKDGNEIAALLRAGIAASKRLEDFEADFRATMSEECARDEKHCSCVPHLRREISSLHAEIKTFGATVAAAQADSARLAAHVCTDNRETLKNALAEIERLREDELASATEYEMVRARYGTQLNEAWLAAWDAEWYRQFETEDLCSLATDYHDSCVKNAKLRELLERAAGELRERCIATGGDDGHARKMALLAEIEGVGK